MKSSNIYERGERRKARNSQIGANACVCVSELNMLNEI